MPSATSMALAFEHQAKFCECKTNEHRRVEATRNLWIARMQAAFLRAERLENLAVEEIHRSRPEQFVTAA